MMAILLLFGVIYLLLVIKVIQIPNMPKYLKTAAFFQISFIYFVSVMIIFAELLSQDILFWLPWIIIVQAVYQSCVIETLEARIVESDLEIQNLRMQFGLGKSSRDIQPKEYLKPQLFAQFFIALYYFGLEKLQPHFQQHGGYKNFYIYHGIPIIAEGAIAQIKKQKKKKYDELEMTRTRLKYYDEEADLNLLWGAGKVVQPQKKSRIFKQLLHYTCQILNFIFLIGILICLAEIILNNFFNSNISVDTWQIVTTKIPEQIKFLEEILAVIVKLVFTGSLLYLGNESLHQMRKNQQQGKHLSRKEQQRLALQGSKCLMSIIVCSVTLLILTYPSLMIKQQNIGSLIQSTTQRKDIIIGLYCLNIYAIVLIIIKIASLRHKTEK